MGNSQGLQNNGDEDQSVNNSDIRVLPRIKDPRSPTDGIIRTPIEVKSTPKAAIETNKQRALNADSPSMLNGMKNAIEVNRLSVYKTQVDGVAGVAGALYEKPYLETDLDTNDDGVIVTKAIIQHRRIKQVLLIDEQHVTRNNEETSQKACIDSLSTRIDRVSFDDTSLLLEADKNDSCMDDERILNKLESLEDWQIPVEEGRRSISFESLDKSVFKIKEPDHGNVRKCIKVKPFMTPDGKKMKKSLTPRRPLSCLSKNISLETTKSGTKRKVWRDIQEERKRRGVHLADENTPPLPPPMDKVSSAPGKLTRRRIVDWDHDATVFI